MTKSAYTTLLVLVALVALSASVSAQSPATTTTVASTTAAATTTTTTVTQAHSTITSSASTTITAAPQPIGSNFTGLDPSYISSLATLVSSLDSGRKLNPGYSPTPAANANGKSAAAGSMLSEQSRGTVMIGLAMVIATTLLAAVGTVAF
ncbi:hypothetical protein BGX26_011609 [Mortierella sp. AD094]|nr:hypothetical protein BGX26_011609 [Mortierella sp. AD094]